MPDPEIQTLFRKLRSALGLDFVTTGLVMLNVNDDTLASYDAKVHGRVDKSTK